jgi:Tfp pilus assembly protein PilN
LLIIVARNIVKKQFMILERAGVRLEKVVLVSESLAWSVPRIARLETGTAPLSILHIDENFTDFIVVSKNKPVFIRNISIGTQQLYSEKDTATSRFIDEIKRSFEAYQTEDIEKGPRALVMTGAIEDLGEMESTLRESMPMQVSRMPYLDKISLARGALKSPDITKRSSFFNIISALLAWRELGVNLIPEEVKLRKSVEERGRDLIKTGVLVLAIFVLFFSSLISKIYFRSSYLDILNVKYATLSKQAEKLEGQFNRVVRIKSYLTKRGHSLEVLGALHDTIPLELELNDIRYDQEGKLTVKGTARSMSTVFSFVDSMERSDYFSDVKTRYTTKRKEGKRDVTDFEINCILEKITKE